MSENQTDTSRDWEEEARLTATMPEFPNEAEDVEPVDNGIVEEAK